MLRRLVTEYPETGAWLTDVIQVEPVTREVRIVPIGRDVIVVVSPPLTMAKAEIEDTWENTQLA